MVDVDTFLTILYVTVDDFCQSHLPQQQESRPPGPQASLSPSEVATLAIFAQWGRFASERDFYRYAQNNLRDAFPNPASSFAIQPAGTPEPRSHRAAGLAPGSPL